MVCNKVLTFSVRVYEYFHVTYSYYTFYLIIEFCHFSKDCIIVSFCSSAGEDFMHVNTIVEIGSGETEVTVSIPLIDDVFPEDPESFEVFLSASPGVYIQSPAAANILINDRDPDLPSKPLTLCIACLLVALQLKKLKRK